MQLVQLAVTVLREN